MYLGSAVGTPSPARSGELTTGLYSDAAGTVKTGILGTGAVVRRPMVIRDADGNETIGIRSMVYLALSYDHRVVDGADAARFLVTMKERLEEGAFEADLGL